ncbi:MAG: hypothetical protein AAGA68_23655 [Pseudomonadota bacterium]
MTHTTDLPSPETDWVTVSRAEYLERVLIVLKERIGFTRLCIDASFETDISIRIDVDGIDEAQQRGHNPYLFLQYNLLHYLR